MQLVHTSLQSPISAAQMLEAVFISGAHHKMFLRSSQDWMVQQGVLVTPRECGKVQSCALGLAGSPFCVYWVATC